MKLLISPFILIFTLELGWSESTLPRASSALQEILRESGFEHITPSIDCISCVRRNDGSMLELLFYPSDAAAAADFHRLAPDLQESKSSDGTSFLKRTTNDRGKTSRAIFLESNWLLSGGGLVTFEETSNIFASVQRLSKTGDPLLIRPEIIAAADSDVELETIFGAEPQKIAVRDIISSRKPQLDATGDPQIYAEAMQKFDSMPIEIRELFAGFTPISVELWKHDPTLQGFGDTLEKCDTLSVNGNRNLNISLYVYTDANTAQKELERKAQFSSISDNLELGTLGLGSLINTTAGNHCAHFRVGAVRCYISGMFENRKALLNKAKIIQKRIEDNGREQILEKWKASLPIVPFHKN